MEDIQRRLNLLRYGMLVIVLLAFGITAAYSIFANLGSDTMIMSALINGVIAFVITGVVMAAVYFGYAAFLKRGGSE